jgi:hypothetical protein
MTSKERETLLKMIGRLVFSAAFIVIGSYYVSKGGDLRPIGTGFLGTVIGYWVK